MQLKHMPVQGLIHGGDPTLTSQLLRGDVSRLLVMSWIETFALLKAPDISTALLYALALSRLYHILC